jgi:hypothetical protein
MGHGKVQGGGYKGGQGSSDSAANDASGESRRIALKALAEDEVCQRREQLANESNDSSEPPKPPDDPAKRRTQSPSVELEGERMTAASCDVEPAEGEQDASEAPERVEDDCERPRKLPNTSERVNERSERKRREDLPERTKVESGDPDSEADVSAASGSIPGEEPDEPDDEAVVPDDLQNDPERPRSVSNERVDRTNAPSPDKAPGGHKDDQEALRDVEGDSDRGTVVDSAEHDGMCPSSRRNEREDKTNAPHQRNSPEGHLGEPEVSRGVEGVRDRESVVDSAEYDGRRGGKHGATSGARRDSKRVETTLLAGDEPGQHGKRKRERTDVPGPSRPPTSHPRSLTNYFDPLRRPGRMKTQPRKISREDLKRTTYRVVQRRRGRIRHIGHVGCVIYVVQVPGKYPRPISEQHDTAEDEDSRSRAPRTAQRCTRAVTYHMWKPGDSTSTLAQDAELYSFEH